MAFWQRKSGSRIFVYYWDSATARQKVISRHLTKHLDHESDKTIDTWVKQWTDRNGVKPSKTLLLKPINQQHLLQDVENFCAYLKDEWQRHQYTIEIHKRNLLYFALPFFFENQKIKELSAINTQSRLLGPWLRSNFQLRESKVRSVHLSLRLFWKWLIEEGRADGTLVLRGGRIAKSTTPLRKTVDPISLLSWSTDREDVRMLGLLAYFFSLRPQELLALRPCDFIAGSLAKDQEPCRVMSACGLYDRLLVRIHRQRSRSKIGFLPPKAGSQGLVACFDEQSAKEIVPLLNQGSRDRLIFPHGNDWYFKLWRRHGFPGLTLKDCRRASLYWLGHYTDLDIVALRNHARHSNISTTALYTRRPFDDLEIPATELSLEI